MCCMTKRFLNYDERETHITWTFDDQTASIYTIDPSVIRKLDKMVARCPECYKLDHEDDWKGNRACYYKVPSKLISFRTPSVPRQLTDEQRQAAAERLRKVRENKGNNGAET